jgi:hypothetical protein
VADGGAPTKRRKRFDEQGRKLYTTNSPGNESKRKPGGPKGERPRWADGVIARSRKVDERDKEARRLYGTEPEATGDWFALNVWAGVS